MLFLKSMGPEARRMVTERGREITVCYAPAANSCARYRESVPTGKRSRTPQGSVASTHSSAACGAGEGAAEATTLTGRNRVYFFASSRSLKLVDPITQ